MEASSCTPGEPFIKLDENGTAPVLSYNLPQSTCYNLVSYMALQIPREQWKPETLNTVSPFWSRLEQLRSLSAVSIREAIRTNPNGLMVNGNVLRAARATGVATSLSDARRATLEANAPAARSANPAATGAREALSRMAPYASPEAMRVQMDAVRSAEPTAQRPSIAAVEDDIAQNIAQGRLPIIKRRLSGQPQVSYVQKPTEATPTISIVMHMRMCSYLGDYGAGQTIKTFSLLPGEKTTIEVRHFQQYEQTRHQAENVLDSFSESSAEELQTAIEDQRQFTSGETVSDATAMGSSSNYTSNSNWNAGGSIGLEIGVFSLGAGGGGGGGSTSGGGTTFTNTNTLNSSTQEMVTALNNAVSHHVAQSDRARQIEVNTESTERTLNETEETITRVLENINHSRVLNFVFRQLLQEYFTITYLHDISFVYSNGFPESRKTCKLANLETMLDQLFVTTAAKDSVRNQIFTYLCNIADYQGTLTSFIERVSEQLGNCITPGATTTFNYVRKKAGLSQTYRGRSVDGIILNVASRILRTGSVIVDALLGQGEALDCYNQQLQNAAVISAQTQNQARQQEIQRADSTLQTAVDVIEGIVDPIDKAKYYNKIMRDCCDIAQVGGNCCCGGNSSGEENPKP